MNLPRPTPESHIIAIAQKLFTEQGFKGTSMSDIAREAGITRPTLHYYFRTKERMFQAVFAPILQSFLLRFDVIFQQDTPITSKLEQLADAYIELYRRHPFLPQFVCSEIQRDVQHMLAAIKTQAMAHYAETIRSSLLQEMAEGKIRSVPLSMVFTTLYSALFFPFLVQPLLIELFLEGKPERFELFLEDWKKQAKAHIRLLLSPETLPCVTNPI